MDDPAVVKALKQIEQDMGQAMVAVDLEKLNRIFAEALRVDQPFR